MKTLILSTLCLIAMLVIGFNVYLNNKLINIEQKLAEYSIQHEGVSILRVPNFFTGDLEEYAAINLLHEPSGLLPVFIHKSEYEGFYTKLRLQILSYEEVAESLRSD